MSKIIYNKIFRWAIYEAATELCDMRKAGLLPKVASPEASLDEWIGYATAIADKRYKEWEQSGLSYKRFAALQLAV